MFWPQNHQRDMEDLVIGSEVFKRHTVLGDLFSMIGGDDHDGVVEGTLLVKGGEQAGNFFIYIPDRGIIEGSDLFDFRRRKISAPRELGVIFESKAAPETPRFLIAKRILRDQRVVSVLEVKPSEERLVRGVLENSLELLLRGDLLARRGDLRLSETRKVDRGKVRQIRSRKRAVSVGREHLGQVGNIARQQLSAVPDPIVCWVAPGKERGH